MNVEQFLFKSFMYFQNKDIKENSDLRVISYFFKAKEIKNDWGGGAKKPTRFINNLQEVFKDNFEREKGGSFYRFTLKDVTLYKNENASLIADVFLDLRHNTASQNYFDKFNLYFCSNLESLNCYKTVLRTFLKYLNNPEEIFKNKTADYFLKQLKKLEQENKDAAIFFLKILNKNLIEQKNDLKVNKKDSSIVLIYKIIVNKNNDKAIQEFMKRLDKNNNIKNIYLKALENLFLTKKIDNIVLNVIKILTKKLDEQNNEKQKDKKDIELSI